MTTSPSSSEPASSRSRRTSSSAIHPARQQHAPTAAKLRAMAATQQIGVAMGRTELRLAKTAAEDEGVSLSARGTRSPRRARAPRGAAPSSRELPPARDTDRRRAAHAPRVLEPRSSGARASPAATELPATLMPGGITLDTGALIALEAGRLAMRKVYYAALSHGVTVFAESRTISRTLAIAWSMKDVRPGRIGRTTTTGESGHEKSRDVRYEHVRPRVQAEEKHAPTGVCSPSGRQGGRPHRCRRG